MLGLTRQEIVRHNLEKIIHLFESGQVAQAMERSIIKPPNIPIARWSMGNKLLAFIHGTSDARGFRQWQEAGRHVRTGAKAFYIFGPLLRKIEKEDPETGEVEEIVRLAGFKTIPVFAVEDTEGEPLDYNLTPKELPVLYDVAVAWGIKIHYEFTGPKYYGYYRPTTQEIALATHDELTFLHELSHASYDRAVRPVIGGQDAHQEIIAEFCGYVLARMYGKQDPKEGTAYQYVVAYADKIKKPLGSYLWSIIHEVEQVLNHIINTYEELKGGEAGPRLLGVANLDTGGYEEYIAESEGYWPFWAELR